MQTVIPEELPTPILRDAATVTLVVHGVGDHSPADILNAAESGLRPVLPPEQARQDNTTRLGLNSLLPEGRGEVSLGGLRVSIGESNHYILALVWSDTLARIAAIPFLPGLNPFFSPLAAALAQVERAACVWWDVCQLVVHARKWWRLAAFIVLAAFTAVLTAWAAVGTLSAFALAVFRFDLFKLQDSDLADALRHFLGIEWTGFHETAGPWLGVLIVATYLIAHGIAFGYDFIGDVAAYVARRGHKERLIRTVAQTIDTIAGECPAGTRVFVVGHSLGSVLVSHALLELRKPPGNLILVTLGSPLALMSSVFSAAIERPTALLRDLRANGIVRLWCHLYRDSDIIGRSLMEPADGYVEASLGDGPHWNYFSDARLWTRLKPLVTESLSGDFGAFSKQLEQATLRPGEVCELRELVILRLAAPLLIALALSCEVILAAYAMHPYARDLLGIRLGAGAAILVLGASATVVACLSWLKMTTGPPVPQRAALQHARFWRFPLAVALSTSLAGSALVAALFVR